MTIGRAVSLEPPLLDVHDSDRVGRPGPLPPSGDADDGVAHAEESFLDAKLDAVLDPADDNINEMLV